MSGSTYPANQATTKMLVSFYRLLACKVKEAVTYIVMSVQEREAFASKAAIQKVGEPLLQNDSKMSLAEWSIRALCKCEFVRGLQLLKLESEVVSCVLVLEETRKL